VVKVKAAVSVFSGAVAINDAILGAGFRADGDGLAQKLDIPIAVTGVGAVGDDYLITIVGVVDCRLDVVEIRWAVVINRDYSTLAGYG